MKKINKMEEKKSYISVGPVALEITKKIIQQMEDCVCKIKYGDNICPGFFCKIPLDENNKCNALITSYELFGKEYKLNNKNEIIKIFFNDENDYRIIQLDKNRKIYSNSNLGILIIIIEDKDNINSKKLYLELDENLFKENYSFKDKSIYILQYKNGNEISVSYGKIKKINEDKIHHYCMTDDSSYGSPILNLTNNKVIGMLNNTKKSGFYLGTFLKLPINEVIKMKEKILGNNNKEDNYNLKITETSHFTIKAIPRKNINITNINQEKNHFNPKTRMLNIHNQINNLGQFNNINHDIMNNPNLVCNINNNMNRINNINNNTNFVNNINMGMNAINNIENENSNYFPFKDKYINDLCKEEGPKLNIIIEFESNKKGINIRVNHGHTVHQLLITFLKIIGKPDLEGSKYIKFIYNNKYLNINNQTEIQNIFHNVVKIFYQEPQGIMNEIIFKTTKGLIKRIFIYAYSTVSDLLKEYLNEIGKPEYFGNKDKIKFMYKGENIDFEKKEKIVNFFKEKEENIVTVADLEKSIDK